MLIGDPAPGMAIIIIVTQLRTFLPVLDVFVDNKVGSSFFSLELDAGVN